MKKVISLLLVFAMVFTMFSTVLAETWEGFKEVTSGNVVQITLGDENNSAAPSAGYVTVPVKLSALPTEVVDVTTGIAGGQFDILFDGSKLTFVMVETKMQMAESVLVPTPGLKKTDTSWTAPTVIDADDDETTQLKKFTAPFVGTGSARIMPETYSDAEGVLCNLWFTVNDGAKGSSNITISNMTLSTNNAGNDYSWKADYYTYSTCKVKISDVYSVTKAANAEDHGTVTFAVDGGKNEAELDGNETVTITATPDDGYSVGTITVTDADGNPVTVSENKFTMPTKNVTVDVTYVANKYAVTINEVKANETAGVTFTGIPADGNVAFGTEVTLVPALDAGVTLETLTATSEGKDAGGDTFGTVDLKASDYKFTMPSGAVTISGTASYQAGTYQVKLSDDSSANDNTMYEITGLGSYADGKTVTVTVTPKDGYNIAISDITGGVDSVTSPYTFTMPRLETETTPYLIKVDATKKVYPLTPGVEGSTVTVDGTLGTKATVKFAENATASIGDTVNFTIMPNSADVTIDTAKIKATNGVGGDNIDITWGALQLFGYGYAGSFTMPANGVVVFSTTDGTDGTVSALAKLTEVTLTYEGKNADGTYTSQTEPVAFASGKVTKGLGKFLDSSATPAKTLTINVTGKSDGATAEIYEGQYTVENKPAVANIYANDKTLGAKAQATFTIFVKAADMITEEAYVLVVTNTTDPAGGATIELVTKSGTAAEPDADPTAATGSRYEAAIVAKGLSTVGSVNAISFDLKLPTHIMTDGNSEHGVTYTIGSGIAYNNINMINYDATTGVLSFSVVNGGTAFAETDGAVELLNISFEILDGIDVESFPDFEITWNSAKYADGDEASAKDFGTNAFVETVKLVRSNEEILASKIADIDALANELEYSEQKWENEVLPILDQAKKDVAAANLTEDQMDDIVEAAGVAVGKIQKLASDVTYNDGTQDVTVTAYKTELSNKILEGVVLGNYLPEDQLKITDTTENDGIAEVAKKAIEDSKSRDEDVLARIVTDAKDDIADVLTKAEQIKKYQDMITVDESKYVDEALDTTVKDASTGELNGAVAEAIRLAKKAIAEATSTEDMQDIVDNFATTYSALETELLTTVRPEYDVKVADLSNGFTDVEIGGTKYTAKKVDTTNYTQENIDKIEIYQSIANAKIAATTSEVAMQAAVDEAMKKIAGVPTIENAVTAAIEKINKYDETGYGLEDIITAVGQDMAGDVSVYNEALYEAAIEYAKSKDTDGKLDQSQIQAAVTEVNTIISVNTDADDTNDTFLKGDFNVSTNVDLQDVAGSMKYVCGTLTWVPQAQGVYNADIHTPGDGVLTVFDVAEIMQIVDAQ